MFFAECMRMERCICLLLAMVLLGFTANGRAEGQHSPTLPPVIEVQRRALSYAHFDIPEILSWKRKARVAALVPRVQFDFGKRLRDNINIGIQDNVYVGSSGIVVGPEEGDYSNTYTSDITIGVRAVWEFGDAVFNAKQLAAASEARRAVHDRNELLAQVNRHYFTITGFAEQARLLRMGAKESKKPALVELKIHERRVACRESVAELDALTDGWFSEVAPQAAKRSCGE